MEHYNPNCSEISENPLWQDCGGWTEPVMWIRNSTHKPCHALNVPNKQFDRSKTNSPYKWSEDMKKQALMVEKEGFLLKLVLFILSK